jgi:hypothetical protein
MKKYSVLFFGLLLLSCKEPLENSSSKESPSVVGWNNSTSIAGFLETYAIRYESDGGYSDRFNTRCVFYDTSGNITLGGLVTRNSVSIPHVISIYESRNSTTFNTTHVWEVAGQSSIPYIKDSVTAPSLFRISYPSLYTDTVSKLGFTCTYSDPLTDSIYVLIQYDSVSSVFRDTSVHYPSRTTYYVAANTGSVSIPGTLLTSFPNKGVIRIIVGADKEKEITVNSRKFLLRAASASSTYCFIKN